MYLWIAKFTILHLLITIRVRLVNHLSEHAGLPKISFRAKANIVFVQLANVEKFLEAAREYGNKY